MVKNDDLKQTKDTLTQSRGQDFAKGGGGLFWKFDYLIQP